MGKTEAIRTRKIATAENKMGGGIASSFQFWCCCVIVAVPMTAFVYL
jgi:hypothetical protein